MVTLVKGIKFSWPNKRDKYKSRKKEGASPEKKKMRCGTRNGAVQS